MLGGATCEAPTLQTDAFLWGHEMAEHRTEVKWPASWEALGLIFAYFVAAKDLPTVMRMLQIPRCIPRAVKDLMLWCNSSSDFWYLIWFAIGSATAFLFFLPRTVVTESQTEDQAQGGRPKTVAASSEREDLIRKAAKNAVAAMKHDHLLRGIRSLGLMFLREFILERLGVALYGTFKRPSTWSAEPDRHVSIDRITYHDGRGIEFQYPRTNDQLIVRTHPPEDDTYRDEKRAPTRHERVVLLFASNFYPRWCVTSMVKRLLLSGGSMIMRAWLWASRGKGRKQSIK